MCCGMWVTHMGHIFLRFDLAQLCEQADTSTPRENISVFYQDKKTHPRYAAVSLDWQPNSSPLIT